MSELSEARRALTDEEVRAVLLKWNPYLVGVGIEHAVDVWRLCEAEHGFAVSRPAPSGEPRRRFS